MLIPDSDIARVREAASIVEVVGAHVALKPGRKEHKGPCPFCGTKKPKFYAYSASNSYHCFVCEANGSVIEFVQQQEDVSFPVAVRHLAERFGVSLTQPDEHDPRPAKRLRRNERFRDVQLLASGLKPSELVYPVRTSATEQVEVERYQVGSVDANWRVVPGDDMILNYVDLDGKLTLYCPPKSKRYVAYRRVRYHNPEAHKSRDGKAVKYRSPRGSGVQLWYPNDFIRAFQRAEPTETLYLVEGEKKADRMVASGLMAIGLGGISSLGRADKMPQEFGRIIKAMAVKRVVMCYDSDWQDIKLEPGSNVDQRPRAFASSAIRFQEYFRTYEAQGYPLELFLMSHHSEVHKGIDDLIVRELQGKPADALQRDIEDAMMHRDFRGEYVQLHKVTQWTTYKFLDLWHLQGIQDFAKAHHDDLRRLVAFKYRGREHRWNEEAEAFEASQVVTPREQFWKEVPGKGDVSIKWDYANCMRFLGRRGFGKYEIRKGADILIHQNSHVVSVVTQREVQNYVQAFAEELEFDHDHGHDILNMVLAAKEQYLGPQKLTSLPFKRPRMLEPRADVVHMVFTNVFWEITATGITERPVSEMDGYVWAERVIDFSPKLHPKPMAQVRVAGGKVALKTTDRFEESAVSRFVQATSWTRWRECFELATDAAGKKYWAELEGGPAKHMTEEALHEMQAGVASKMLSTGYILQPHFDEANAKAIVNMDHAESEVGRSQGGTGKSLFSMLLKPLVPNKMVDGKRGNIETDDFLYDGVTEATQLIWFDDVRVNFNFEWLFTQITNGIRVNGKGVTPFELDVPPRFLINTNHALRGEGNSFRRRQYYNTFSDFFNEHRTPIDFLGGRLLTDFDYEAWNDYYNWMAACAQAYLQHGLSHEIDLTSVEHRRIRQNLGEGMLEFLGLHYDTSPEAERSLVNQQVCITYLYQAFIEAYPTERKYTKKAAFHHKLKQYATYAGLEYNPSAQGGRIKSGATVFAVLADAAYDDERAANNRIRTKEDYERLNSPF